MSAKMTRYKQADFPEDDSSSLGGIQLNEDTASTGMQLRYHTARATSSWRSRKKNEKWLLLSILIMGLAIFILLLLLFSSRSDNSTTTRIVHVQPHSKIQQVPCLSEYCIFAASEILKSIDKTVDPCDDFYGFACNQWIKRNPIPDGKSSWGTFGNLEQMNQFVIRTALEKPLNSFTSEAEKKSKLYYESCMDEEEVMEKLGSGPMIDFLKKIGGWNATKSDFNIEKWSLDKTLRTLQNAYNINCLFAWAIGEDDKNSSRHVIQIDQGGLSLPTRDNYLNKTEAHKKVLAAYIDYMTKVCVLLGANETDAREQMINVLEFETRLAIITTPMDLRRNEEALYNPMKLYELQTLAPFINWTEHFDDAMKIVNRRVNENEVVVVYAPQFLKDLSKVISEYQKTTRGKITINNYLVWQAVRSLAACLSKPFRDAYKGVRKALVGSDGGEETWRYCISDTSNVIGFAIGAMFVREAFHGESKPQAEKMINEVRDAFKRNLLNSSWMDKKTQKLAEDKADAITDMIGFPDYILNNTELDQKYEELQIQPNAYFENNIRVNVFNLKKNLEKLDQLVNKTQWGMTPPTVNAYYTPTRNQIVFPAGILQSPFYDINNPKSLNFGAMGVVMGHELTHAFDDQGREYDKYGNMNRWWEEKSIQRFSEKTDCIAKQYAGYKVKGMALNGKQTLGENIADNGGLKAAYHAYINSKSEKEADILLLPGLNMTHRQLFFISFAQVWCSSVTDEATILQIEKDTHSPAEYRVMGPLSNLKEFADEFKCPPGSKLNPYKRCNVW